MGIFDKKSEEEKLSKKLDGIKAAEVKARGKAAKKGFNVDGAIYVIEAMYPKDDDAKMNLNMPLVAIFEDKVVQTRKSILNSSLEEIPMKNISSVEISMGLIPTVNVYTSGNTLTFRTDVLQGPKFVEVLRECLTICKSLPSRVVDLLHEFMPRPPWTKFFTLGPSVVCSLF